MKIFMDAYGFILRALEKEFLILDARIIFKEFLKNIRNYGNYEK